MYNIFYALIITKTQENVKSEKKAKKTVKTKNISCQVTPLAIKIILWSSDMNKTSKSFRCLYEIESKTSDVKSFSVSEILVLVNYFMGSFVIFFSSSSVFKYLGMHKYTHRSSATEKSYFCVFHATFGKCKIIF